MMNIESSIAMEPVLELETEKGRKEKILIVDDESKIQNILLKQLGNLGYDCRTADNGLKALQMIDDDVFNLVLLDIKMPCMNGIEVLNKVKYANNDVPVVMISACMASPCCVVRLSSVPQIGLDVMRKAASS